MATDNRPRARATETLDIGSRFSVFAHIEQAAENGGDFCAIVPLKDDRVLVVVGDASGKGTEASGLAEQASQIFEEAAERADASLAILLDEVNRALSGAADGEMFVAAFAAVIDGAVASSSTAMQGSRCRT